MLDKDLVKDQLEPDDIFSLLMELGAEPIDNGKEFICKTVCHGGESHKLYYYLEQRLFHCYTQCQDSFDIFDFVSKVKDIDLNTSIFFIANKFNLQHKVDMIEDENLNEDWKILKRWKDADGTLVKNDKIVLPEFDERLLQYYPQPKILDWEKEFISKEICDYMNIRYNPVEGAILIPHYDENGRLIGIRQRTLVQENEKFGKYRPAKLNGKLYNHPLGWNLYGLDIAKDRIEDMGIAIVLESEKAVMQAIGYLGVKNNIAVSMCGASLSRYQLELLLAAGAKEVCIAIDKDYKTLYDDEYNDILKKVDKMYNKYSHFVNLSFMFDTKGLTGYKMSPSDAGKDVFLELWKERIMG